MKHPNHLIFHTSLLSSPADGMELNSAELLYDGSPYILVYKDGRVERSFAIETTPASVDPHTGVSSKDVLAIPATGVSVRIYLPPLTDGKRLPVLLYFHGGAFCLANAFHPMYHTYLNSIAADAGVIAVSVDYRLAPEYPVPAQMDDAWDALNWVASQATGGDSGVAGEAWLADHADCRYVYLAGESAGATIAHHVAMRAGVESLVSGIHISGVALIHPYFLGSDHVESDLMDPRFSTGLRNMWGLVCPSAAAGLDDPWINPLAAGASSLSGMGCKRVFVCVAERDVLRDRGRAFVEGLRVSGWGGKVEMLESKGEGHAFHLINTTCEAALTLNRAVCRFLNVD